MIKQPQLHLLTVGLAILLTTARTPAQRTFSTTYDASRKVTLEGAVTKLEWANPHAYLYVGVEDETGKSETWTFEMGSLSALQKAGWRKDTVKMGDTVTVDGWLARSKSKTNTANMKAIWLSNGRELSGASSIGDTERHEEIKPKASN